jgi:hypothetical protein
MIFSEDENIQDEKHKGILQPNHYLLCYESNVDIKMVSIHLGLFYYHKATGEKQPDGVEFPSRKFSNSKNVLLTEAKQLRNFTKIFYL